MGGASWHGSLQSQFMNQEVYDAIVRPVAFCGHGPFVRGVKYLLSEFMECVHFPSFAFFFSPPGKFQRDISRLRAPPWVEGNLQFWPRIKDGLYKLIFCLLTIMVKYKLCQNPSSVRNGFLCQQESLVLVRALSFERKRPTKSKPNGPKRLVILLTSRCVVLLAYELHPLK